MRLVFFKKVPFGIVIAVRPQTGSVIRFNEEEGKWSIAPQNYYQIASEPTHFDEITEEEARLTFKDILPDEKLLSWMDSLKHGKLNYPIPFI